MLTDDGEMQIDMSHRSIRWCVRYREQIKRQLYSSAAGRRTNSLKAPVSLVIRFDGGEAAFFFLYRCNFAIEYIANYQFIQNRKQLENSRRSSS